MQQILTITKRELGAYFGSLMAYMLLVLFLGFSGFFTWIYGNDIFFIKQTTMMPFFSIAFWTLFFLIPALTMRLFSEENRMGTLKLLLTKPVTDIQIVIGKYLATLILVAIALALTLPYLITLGAIGNLDYGQVASGYLALLLFSSMYISFGLFTSSLTKNQIVSVLLSLLIGVFFQIIFGMLANGTTGVLGSVLNYLSVTSHFNSMIRGLIDSRDLIYFLGFSLVGLLLTEMMILRKRIV